MMALLAFFVYIDYSRKAMNGLFLGIGLRLQKQLGKVNS